ncbi:signal peptidase II [Nonomuraea sp. NPDC050663]|uniref:signal peptidase II n=1 Tax=Nonomuraea sp. NPDC050663 TaxID=3364370 RepID=UPI003791E516
MRDLQAEGGAPVEPASEAEAPAPVAGARRKLVVLLACLALGIYAADLITKTIVLRTLPEYGPPTVIIPEVLQFRLIFNSGAAFSIGTGMTIIFTIIAASVVVAIIRTARKLRSLPWAICLGMLLGGALGNLTDRLFRHPGGLQGHVVDFIEIFPGHWPIIENFPIWNIADASIVCGGILAVILAWRGYQIDGTRETGK